MPLETAGTIDSTTWAALALVLTIVAAGYAWVAWRRRGLAAGMRGVAWALLPIAAWLTGTLELVAGIVEDVVSWAATLVFSPVVWLGVVVAGLAVALWILSGLMRARGIGVREQDSSLRSARRTEVAAGKPAGKAAGKSADGQPAARRPAKGKGDDDIEDIDEIEAILKRHGI